jgi:hypothetical protein
MRLLSSVFFKQFPAQPLAINASTHQAISVNKHRKFELQTGTDQPEVRLVS